MQNLFPDPYWSPRHFPGVTGGCLGEGKQTRISLGGRDHETLRGQLSGPSGGKCLDCGCVHYASIPPSQTQITATSRMCKLNQYHACRRQSNVSFVSPGIFLAQGPSSFRLVMLTTCIYNLKSWNLLGKVILLKRFFFFFWKVQT